MLYTNIQLNPIKTQEQAKTSIMEDLLSRAGEPTDVLDDDPAYISLEKIFDRHFSDIVDSGRLPWNTRFNIIVEPTRKVTIYGIEYDAMEAPIGAIRMDQTDWSSYSLVNATDNTGDYIAIYDNTTGTYPTTGHIWRTIFKMNYSAFPEAVMEAAKARAVLEYVSTYSQDTLLVNIANASLQKADARLTQLLIDSANINLSALRGH